MTDYTDLKARLQDAAEDDSAEFAAALDVYIQRAERRIYKESKVRRFRTSETVTLSANTEYLSPPSSAVAVRFLRNVGGDYLQEKDETFLTELYPTPTDITGTPRYYALQSNATQIMVVPTTSANASLIVGYTFRPTSITSATTGSTWLSQNANDLLFYACMVELQPWLKAEEQDYKRYVDFYERALQTFDAEENKADEYRNGENR